MAKGLASGFPISAVGRLGRAHGPLAHREPRRHLRRQPDRLRGGHRHDRRAHRAGLPRPTCRRAASSSAPACAPWPTRTAASSTSAGPASWWRASWPTPPACPACSEHCLDEGRLILMNAGTFGDAIRWMPPLVVSEAEIDQALDAFAQGPRRHPLSRRSEAVRLASAADGCRGGRRADGALRRRRRRRRRVLRGARRGRSPRCSDRTGPARPPPIEVLEGFRRPDAGRTSVLGLDPPADHAALTRRVGVMLQAGGVGPGVRVLEALRHAAALYDDAARPGDAPRAGRAHRHRAAHLAPDLRRRAAPARPRPGARRPAAGRVPRRTQLRRRPAGTAQPIREVVARPPRRRRHRRAHDATTSTRSRSWPTTS